MRQRTVILFVQKCMQLKLYSHDAIEILYTGSTFHIITVVSLDPVASLVPSGENRQNQTSSQ